MQQEVGKDRSHSLHKMRTVAAPQVCWIKFKRSKIKESELQMSGL